MQAPVPELQCTVKMHAQLLTCGVLLCAGWTLRWTCPPLQQCSGAPNRCGQGPRTVRTIIGQVQHLVSAATVRQGYEKTGAAFC